jgi:hypothetical protein
MPRWPSPWDDAELRLAQPLLKRPSMMEAAIPAPKPYRMNADVMEIDIAQVIAMLEDEQTLLVSKKQVVAMRKAKRRRSLVNFARWLFRRSA